MENSNKIKRLPPYTLGEVRKSMIQERTKGIDVIDLGMGNPDRPTPQHIVNKLCEVVQDSKTHRYSVSRGIFNARKAIVHRYKEDFDVDLDPETETITVIGAKEGISHLALALLDEGDVALVPNPTYPIHLYSVVIAGGNLVSIPIESSNNFVIDLKKIREQKFFPKPKLLIISYPHNPTTACVDLKFFEEVVAFAKEQDMMVIHDFAYKDLTYDGYKAPSFLQAKGAKDVGVELFSLTKSYNMAGWRMAFALGNSKIIANLAKIKSYMDYGIFTPIQVAAITALKSDQSCVKNIVETYRKRRDVLVEGLNKLGWQIEKPKATMFVWAQIPSKFKDMKSLDFSLMLLKEAAVTTSPGIGFGEYGEGYVRFALVENEERIKQALRSLKKIFL
ncbi:MAG: aminotransferase class I/II-fold pyridoxal phosphate-dependent enzyme [Candidatus Firestonebacteria bacterium]